MFYGADAASSPRERRVFKAAEPRWKVSQQLKASSLEVILLLTGLFAQSCCFSGYVQMPF